MDSREVRKGNLMQTHEGKVITRDLETIYQGVDVFKAIPLTEEWLIKFGFKKMYTHGLQLNVLGSGDWGTDFSYEGNVLFYMAQIAQTIVTPQN